MAAETGNPVRPARGGEAILIALILSHHLPLIVT
ncbi:MAG: hypothetical protein CAPSK01_003931 [Candidatus Accumulibacter vicinus]|uniref:Uncharacterized protein n=1 Tax=Candidatus Accumulibacter vicinus TaxID=2954382 RepID=A0A084XWZ6_9PROT|nr:MAG: hypothetical protein CAPSK01_003931 [Candidatus Accumulibacter vicinus]